ncbi:MAG: hypothetical protein R3C99_07380 [Pirellulaceae bacterium]
MTCDGLGQLFSFDPDLLIPDERLSFKRGAGRTGRALERDGTLAATSFKAWPTRWNASWVWPAGTMLETPWCELDEPLRQLWLHGTGDRNTSRFSGEAGLRRSSMAANSTASFPTLLAKYRGSKSKPQLRQLEKYMRSMGCPDCGGQRLNNEREP